MQKNYFFINRNKITPKKREPLRLANLVLNEPNYLDFFVENGKAKQPEFVRNYSEYIYQLESEIENLGITVT